jgi:hypothetical protein
MNAIVKADRAAVALDMPFGEIERLAEAIAKSGMFGMKTKDQALVLMVIAQAEGRHPALAARDYDVIQGKPAKKAEAMARDFLEAGGKIEWHGLSDTTADATFSHPTGGTARISWDIQRATKAGLAGKDLWQKYPRQMLRSRTVSEGVRTVWPLATSGMYEPGEAADIPQFQGQTIDHQPEPEPTKPAAKQETAPRTTEPAKPAPTTNGNGHPATRTREQWDTFLTKLRAALAVVRTRAEVVEIGGKQTVGDALATGPQDVQREISAALAEAYGRFPDEPEPAPEHAATPPAPEDGEVEIAGAKYASA